MSLEILALQTRSLRILIAKNKAVYECLRVSETKQKFNQNELSQNNGNNNGKTESYVQSIRLVL